MPMPIEASMDGRGLRRLMSDASIRAHDDQPGEIIGVAAKRGWEYSARHGGQILRRRREIGRRSVAVEAAVPGFGAAASSSMAPGLDAAARRLRPRMPLDMSASRGHNHA